MANTADILRKAKARISDNNMWFRGSLCPKGHFPGDDCPHCMYGAILAEGGSLGGHEMRAVKSVIGPLGFSAIGKFNDAPKTTHAMIMDVFDKAIAAAEATQ